MEFGDGLDDTDGILWRRWRWGWGWGWGWGQALVMAHPVVCFERGIRCTRWDGPRKL